MSSRLTNLLARLRSDNAALAADLEKEISALTERRSFGLNFERQVPLESWRPERRSSIDPAGIASNRSFAIRSNATPGSAHRAGG